MVANFSHILSNSMLGQEMATHSDFRQSSLALKYIRVENSFSALRAREQVKTRVYIEGYRPNSGSTIRSNITRPNTLIRVTKCSALSGYLVSMATGTRLVSESRCYSNMVGACSEPNVPKTLIPNNYNCPEMKLIAQTFISLKPKQFPLTPTYPIGKIS